MWISHSSVNHALSLVYGYHIGCCEQQQRCPFIQAIKVHWTVFSRMIGTGIAGQKKELRISAGLRLEVVKTRSRLMAHTNVDEGNNKLAPKQAVSSASNGGVQGSWSLVLEWGESGDRERDQCSVCSDADIVQVFCRDLIMTADLHPYTHPWQRRVGSDHEKISQKQAEDWASSEWCLRKSESWITVYRIHEELTV